MINLCYARFQSRQGGTSVNFLGVQDRGSNAGHNILLLISVMLSTQLGIRILTGVSLGS